MDAGTDSAARRERRPILGRPGRQPRCQRLGGLHSADILLHSVDFEQVVRLQRAGRWDAAADLLG